MKGYRKGNYYIEKSYYGTFDVWCMRSLVKHFQTIEEAKEYIEGKINQITLVKL